MVSVWILYLELLLGSIILLIFQQQWVAWLLLMALLWLPVLSLVVSLPAMLTAKIKCGSSGVYQMHEKVTVHMVGKCKFPLPRYRYDLQVVRVPTGESWRLRNQEKLPTDHCGQLQCNIKKCYVYDYLRLFRLPVRMAQNSAVVVMPKPVKTEVPTALERRMALRWRPKVGGGFSENHELRLYRPGDSLNQVHWKLSAKTGKLMIREAMEPIHNRLLIQLELCGSATEIDRKMGRLLYLGGQLLQRQIDFEIQVLAQEGIKTSFIHTQEELNKAIAKILCNKPAKPGQGLEVQNGAWCLHIGGQADEV